MRAGIPIETHGVHPKVRLNAGIDTSMLFTELDACIAANLDPHEWHYGVRYLPKFKALIVAWYDAKQRIALHIEDARFRKQKTK